MQKIRIKKIFLKNHSLRKQIILDKKLLWIDFRIFKNTFDLFLDN